MTDNLDKLLKTNELRELIKIGSGPKNRSSYKLKNIRLHRVALGVLKNNGLVKPLNREKDYQSYHLTPKGLELYESLLEFYEKFCVDD